MNTFGFRRALKLSMLGTAIAIASCAMSQEGADAPTNQKDPAVLDSEWQASVQKYDGQRKRELTHVDEVIHQGPFRADWQSLEHYSIPEWYKDAKFGIFVHWGAYSVPAFGSEWYPREMYQRGSDAYQHHLATYGPLTKFGYKDFIPMFKAEKFDPAAWADLFRASGARYVVPVFEHHDGFAMYDSALSDWTAVKMGPHRDLMGDLVKALRSDGLHVGASFHRVEHDFFFEGGRDEASDVNDPQFASLYGPAHHRINRGEPLADDFTYVSEQWTDDWLARAAEIVDKYHPELIYFDWWDGQPSVRSALTRFAAFYYNESLSGSKSVGVLNYKYSAMEEHSGVLDMERGQTSDIRPLAWQSDTSISNKSWGFIENDTFKTPEFIVCELVDIVSKNGNLLLNVGPHADGTIPAQAQTILKAIGQWLHTNGEAIYGTRPWETFGEGPTKVNPGAFHDTETVAYTPEDFRFTTKNQVLYVIGMRRPQDGEAVVHALAAITGRRRVSSVEMLGSTGVLKFEQREDGLHVEVPKGTDDGMPYVLRVAFQ